MQSRERGGKKKRDTGRRKPSRMGNETREREREEGEG